jgi:hypothetical protein
MLFVHGYYYKVIAMSNTSNSELEFDMPCLLLAFVRPEGTLRNLRQLAEHGFKRIYISIDGPRNGVDSSIQTSMEKEIYQLSAKYDIQVRINKSKINQGLSTAVLKGINWFFSIEEHGIILEDDLMVNPDFFNFAQISINVINSGNRPAMFSGNQFFADCLPEDQRRVCTYPLIWGWGTTKWSWLEFVQAYDQENSTPLKDAPLRVRNFLSYGRRRALDRRVDSWAIPLSAFMHDRGYVCWLPPVNLIMNVGEDTQATHTDSGFRFLNIPTENLSSLQNYFTNYSPRVENNLDRLIEKELYSIGARHAFLPFYDLIFRVFGRLRRLII